MSVDQLNPSLVERRRASECDRKYDNHDLLDPFEQIRLRNHDAAPSHSAANAPDFTQDLKT